MARHPWVFTKRRQEALKKARHYHEEMVRIGKAAIGKRRAGK